MNLNLWWRCFLSPDTLKKKKKIPASIFTKQCRSWGSEGVQDKRPATLWVASSSLFILKTSLGAPGIQLPQNKSSGLQGAGFLLFLLVSPQEVLKYCPEMRRGTHSHHLLPTPSTTPWSSSPWWARVHITPPTPVIATPDPSRRGTTAWRAPKRFISVVSIMVISIQGAGTARLWHSLGRSWAPSAWKETLISHVTF